MAEAASPDADRAFPDASAYLPEWIVHLLARLILFLRAHSLAAGHRRVSGVPSWFHAQPNLPPVSARTRAVPARGAFGQTMAWMRRRRGIGSGRPYGRERTSTIAAFGGSLHGVRAGLLRCGLPWRENPAIAPGMTGMTATTPAADRMVMPLSPKNAFAPPSALTVAPCAAELAFARYFVPPADAMSGGGKKLAPSGRPVATAIAGDPRTHGKNLAPQMHADSH